MAWGCFSAVPCPHKVWDEKCRKWMLAMLPLIGLLMGAVWAGIYLLMELIGLPTIFEALVMTLYPFLISGCIHLDGFMDVSDAVLSRRDLPERQRILKDSNVGAFAVISVVMLFLAIFAAMYQIADTGSAADAFILAAMLCVTRLCVSEDTMTKRSLGTSQYAKTEKKDLKGPRIFMLAILAAALILIIIPLLLIPSISTFELWKIWALPAAAFAAKLAGAFARKQLDGMSGDIAGYSLCWGELIGLITLALIGAYL